MSLKYTLDEAISAWRFSCKVASFASGKSSNCSKDYVLVTANAGQRNIAREESIKYQQSFTISKTDLSLVSTVPSVDVSNEKLKTCSRSSNLSAILREIPDSKSAKKENRQLLEIWRNGFLENSVDLQQFDKHGKIYTDGTFGCFELSPDEKHLIYLAERKEVKKQSFMTHGIIPQVEGANLGNEYEFTEDWGEQLVGKSQPVICIFNVNFEPLKNSENPVRVFEPNNDWSPGQMTWCSNDQVVGVAWFHHPRRLGLIYCSNRPSKLFKLSLSTGQYEWFGKTSETAASPRCHQESNSIVYLKSQAYGPHHKEQKIVCINDKGMNTVDLETCDSYRGMYNQAFPSRCWSPSGKEIIFTSPCKSSIQSYVLELDFNRIRQLSLPEGCSGSVVLDVFEDLILVNGVSLTQPDQLFIGRIDYTALDKTVVWQCLSSGTRLPTDFKLASDLLTFHLPDQMEYEATLIYKAGIDKSPLIVCPHGGPHSGNTDQFKSEAYFFIQLGYSVLLINYRGSTGYGEANLNSLLGNVGVQDVQEVHNATVKALEKHPFLCKEKVFLFGGSHGGFLVTHLSGQFPDFYRAVSTRNPVTDIASMFPITDIADWTIVEANLGDGSELENLLTPEMMSRMWEHSPIRYVKQVKAPTLLLVGKVDRRVPPTQSLEYYRALQLHGKKVRMLMYEDCHSLSQLPVDTDALINTVLWFKESVEEPVKQ